MDGFYVAKIQKLSDKRKGVDDKAVTENAQDEVKDESMKVGMDGNKNHSTRQVQKGKKRGQASKVDADDNGEQSNLHKRSKISVAPNAQGPKSKNKKTNAKMTKPRRMKITGM